MAHRNATSHESLGRQHFSSSALTAKQDRCWSALARLRYRALAHSRFVSLEVHFGKDRPDLLFEIVDVRLQSAQHARLDPAQSDF